MLFVERIKIVQHFIGLIFCGGKTLITELNDFVCTTAFHTIKVFFFSGKVEKYFYKVSIVSESNRPYRFCRPAPKPLGIRCIKLEFVSPLGVLSGICCLLLVDMGRGRNMPPPLGGGDFDRNGFLFHVLRVWKISGKVEKYYLTKKCRMNP